MYSISKECDLKLKEIKDFDGGGFVLKSQKKSFTIEGQKIRAIKVKDKKMANPLAFRKVNKKYQKLISFATDLLVSEDDEEGSSYEEVLNLIEKFRLEIKNKYREFLTKGELEHMSKQLKVLQKQAKEKLELMHYSMEVKKTSGKSR